MYHSMRSLEIYRASQEEPAESCDQCFLRRSNAIRRKGRRGIASRGTTLRKVQTVRHNFENCLDRCVLLEGQENRTGIIYRCILKRLRILQMKQIKKKTGVGKNLLNRLSHGIVWETKPGKKKKCPATLVSEPSQIFHGHTAYWLSHPRNTMRLNRKTVPLQVTDVPEFEILAIQRIADPYRAICGIDKLFIDLALEKLGAEISYKFT